MANREYWPIRIAIRVEQQQQWHIPKKPIHFEFSIMRIIKCDFICSDVCTYRRNMNSQSYSIGTGIGMSLSNLICCTRNPQTQWARVRDTSSLERILDCGLCFISPLSIEIFFFLLVNHNRKSIHITHTSRCLLSLKPSSQRTQKNATRACWHHVGVLYIVFQSLDMIIVYCYFILQLFSVSLCFSRVQIAKCSHQNRM